MNNLMTFGEKLRQYRLARGHTQLSLAYEYGRESGKKYGASPSAISQLEIGERKPSRATVNKLASILGLNDEERDTLLLSAGFTPQAGQFGATLEYALENTGIDTAVLPWIIDVIKRADLLTENDRQEITNDINARIRRRLEGMQ